MTSYTKCKNEREAIKEARLIVRDEGGTAHVLLANGDTLTITLEGAKVHSGWVRSGDIYCGPKAYAIAQ